MSYPYLLCFCVFLFNITLYAQEAKMPCSTPDLAMRQADIADYVRAMEQNRYAYRHNQDSIVIPTVIHNIHHNYAGYISDERLLKAFKQVNDALANRGDFYDPQGVDTHIRLCLAKRDPEGNPSTGILHTQDRLGWDFDSWVLIGSFHKGVQWDKKRYFNIYIMDVERGRANFPWASSEATDMATFSGIMMHSSYIGLREGIAILTHEVGHYLGLYHPFRSSCSNSKCLERNDFVCDTPPDSQDYTYCGEYINSCTTDVNPDDPNNPFTEDQYDMIQNYMDGSPCRSRFTQGQVERMYWALETYRPELTEGLENRCEPCEPIICAIQTEQDYGIVGEPLLVQNTSTASNASYQWYLDSTYIGNTPSIELMVDTPGVRILRLQAQQQGVDSLCQGTWSIERPIMFRCSDTPIALKHPSDYYQVDSCYSMDIEGIGDYQWQVGTATGMGNPMTFCLDSVGIHALKVAYGEEACYQEDSLLIHAYANELPQRHYFKQRMRFENDSLMAPHIMQIRKLNPYRYLMTGFLYHRHFDSSVYPYIQEQDFHNFFRFWELNTNLTEHWQLYHKDTLLLIQPFDIVIDSTTNNHFYFTAQETYPGFSRNNQIIVGKINMFGRVEWVKRIQKLTYELQSDHRHNFIALRDDYLIVRVGNRFFHISKRGELLKSKEFTTPPHGLFRGLFFYNNQKMLVDSTKTWLFGQGIVYQNDTTAILSDISTREHIILGYFNEAMDSLQYRMYKQPDEYKRIARIALGMAKHPLGLAVYWQTQLIGEEEGMFHHTALVNEEGQFLWHKTFRTTLAESYQTVKEASDVFCLENGDIIVLTKGDDGPYVHQLHFNNQGELLAYRDYDNNHNAENYIYPRNDVTKTNKSASLGQDGFLVTSHTNEYNSERLMVRHIPLDTAYYNCETDAFALEEIDFPLEELTPQPVVIEPVEAYLEEIELHIRKQYFELEPWCSESHPLEDYTITLDTTLLCPDSMLVQATLCRQRSEEAVALSLLCFAQNPMEVDSLPTHIASVTFPSSTTCITHSFTTSLEAQHFLLNAKAAYRRPYTLQKAFFDGHQHLEWNYLNNYAVAAGLCVSTATASASKAKLSLYPNPAQETINLDLEGGRIISLVVYDLLGRQFITKTVKNTQTTLAVQNLPSGIYMLDVLLDSGERIREKFIVQE